MTKIIESIAVYSLVYALAVMGLSLVVGYARIFVLSQAAIFGVGGFTYAVMSGRNISSDLLIVIPVALVIGAVLSVITGLPLFRLAGDYYIVVSLAFQTVIMQGLVNWNSLSGGPPGLYEFGTANVAGVSISTTTDMIWVLVPVIAVAMVVLLWSDRMPYGKTLVGMSDDEAALEAGGVRSASVKLSVFVLAGMLAAVAGVLYVAYLGAASPGDFGSSTSIAMVSMVLVGGAGSLVGPFIGAVLLSSLPYWLNLANLSGYIAGAVTGVVLLLVAFVSPDGITALVSPWLGRVGRTRQPGSPMTREPVRSDRVPGDASVAGAVGPDPVGHR